VLLVFVLVLMTPVLDTEILVIEVKSLKMSGRKIVRSGDAFSFKFCVDIVVRFSLLLSNETVPRRSVAELNRIELESTRLSSVPFTSLLRGLSVLVTAPRHCRRRRSWRQETQASSKERRTRTARQNWIWAESDRGLSWAVF